MNYVIKAGDTLYGISNQFGVSVTDILNINKVDPANLKIGETITIPPISGTNEESILNYTVKKGDSLYALAKKYNTTVSRIIELNNLKSTNLSIGQQLKIPEMYTENNDTLPQYINYTVKKGDTLYKIAKEYNIDVDTLKKDNGLVSNNLLVGQTIKIRTNNNIEDIEECFGEEYIPEENENYTEYIVKKGDSLYQIAKKNNVSVDQIITLNNLKTTALSIGQQLKIPSQVTPTNREYIVKKGDSLYEIAKKYNTTVDSIMSKNKLTSSLLSIGQKLII